MRLLSSCLGLVCLSARLLIAVLQVLDAELHALYCFPNVGVRRTNHVLILLDVCNRKVWQYRFYLFNIALQDLLRLSLLF